MKRIFLIAPLALFLSFCSFAQTTQQQWHHLDPKTDSVMGISSENAYKLLKTLPVPNQPVIVAVIDGGLDTGHEDLKSVLWTNPKEIAGNQKDDDGNGFKDDLHGWNFLGGADGQNAVHEQKEETRLYVRLRPRYENVDPETARKTFNSAQNQEYELWKEIKPYFEKKKAEAIKDFQEDSLLLQQDKVAFTEFKKALSVNMVDTTVLQNLPATDSLLTMQGLRYYQMMMQVGCGNIDCLVSFFEDLNASLKEQLTFDYNENYNGRLLVDDTPSDLSQHNYGNPDISTPLTGNGAAHGTHVTGIIAADRHNGMGVQGVADHVRILFVRAAPDGDERDKDVANAIVYAVDNGAKIINMSFGKAFSPEKAVVDKAVKYAEAKGVLLVVAAGNDHLNVDSTRQYPMAKYLNGAEASNVIIVGASNALNDSTLAASFSNFGPKTVDVFAPGVEIMSTTPGNKYENKQGTSMASPVVAGIAGVLKSYFPKLSPADLKRIILKSAVIYHTQVLKPGTETKVDFASLSKSGGIVNLYEAVKMAISETGKGGGKIGK